MILSLWLIEKSGKWKKLEYVFFVLFFVVLRYFVVWVFCFWGCLGFCDVWKVFWWMVRVR